MNNRQQQFGSALISALFITALTAIIATALIVRQRLLIHQALLVTNTDQMMLLLQGSQYWAQEIIVKKTDLQKTKSLNKKINGTQVKGMIFAEQGLFNINCLQKTANIPKFVRLLQTVEPGIKAKQASDLTRNIVSWLLYSNVDEYYVRQKPPYRAAHQPMVNVSELRAIRGVTVPIYNALKPYITALPTSEFQVDVNYAPAPVLMTLNNTMTLSQAKGLMVCRRQQGLFKESSDFQRMCAGGQDLGSFTVDEKYYKVVAQADRGDQHLTLRSFLTRSNDKNNKDDIKMVWQEMGG